MSDLAAPSTHQTYFTQVFTNMYKNTQIYTNMRDTHNYKYNKYKYKHDMHYLYLQCCETLLEYMSSYLNIFDRKKRLFPCSLFFPMFHRKTDIMRNSFVVLAVNIARFLKIKIIVCQVMRLHRKVQ